MKCFFFVLSLFCADCFAHGGAAVVVRPLLFPRVAIRRAAVVAAPQALVVAQPLVVRQRFVAPLVVQPQAYIAPQIQSYAVPQAFIAPQIQAFSNGCSSSAFFSQ